MKTKCPLRWVSCSPMPSYTSRSYILKPSTAIFHSVARGAAPFCLAASVCAPRFTHFCDLSKYFSYSVQLLAFEVALTAWIQPSQPPSPCSSSVPGVKLVLTRGLFLFLQLFAVVWPMLVPWPMLRSIYLVISTVSAPPAPSDVPLAGQSMLAMFP